MQAKTSSNPYKNAVKSSKTQQQYQNQEESLIFQKFKAAMTKQLNLLNQEQSHIQSSYSKHDKMQQEPKNYDHLLPDLISDQEIMEYIYGKQPKQQDENTNQICLTQQQKQSNVQKMVQENCEDSVEDRYSQFFVFDINKSEMEQQSPCESIKQQSSSTIMTKRQKIPDDHDFVIFTVKCPKLGIQNQELLMKKLALQSRKLELIQQYKVRKQRSNQVRMLYR